MSAPFTDSVIERLIYLFFFRLEIQASLEYKLFLSRQLLFHLAHTTYIQDSKLFLCFLMQLNKGTAIEEKRVEEKRVEKKKGEFLCHYNFVCDGFIESTVLLCQIFRRGNKNTLSFRCIHCYKIVKLCTYFKKNM
jgi:hypothetical protein